MTSASTWRRSRPTRTWPGCSAPCPAARPVRLRYHDEERTIDPYRLEFQRGRWYLTGYDHLRDGGAQLPPRPHRGRRRASPTSPPSSRPTTAVPGQARGTWELGAEEPVRARVRIDGPQASWAVQHVGPDHVVDEAADGSVVARAPGHQPERVPVVRAVVPRARRGARPAGAPRRPDRVALVTTVDARPARMQRLLSMVPWIAAHDGPTLDEVCARFDLTAKELAADLEVMWLVGLPPYTPDALIDVVQEGDRVWIHFADVFDAPQRLTPDQAVALLTAGASVLALPGADADGALARGVAKLAAVLGVDADQVLDVDLGGGGADVLDVLRTAVAEHRRVHLDYYSYGRDERTERDVDPYLVHAEDGSLYVLGHCHLAQARAPVPGRPHRQRHAPRRAVRPARRPAPRSGCSSPTPTIPRVVLDLAAAAAWVAEAYPVESVDRASRRRACACGSRWRRRRGSSGCS